MQGAKGFGTAIGGEEGGENYEQGMRTAVGGLNNVGNTAVDITLGDKSSTDQTGIEQTSHVVNGYIAVNPDIAATAGNGVWPKVAG